MKDPVSIGAALTLATLALLSVWKSRPRRWAVAVLLVVFFAFAALSESEGMSRLRSNCGIGDCSASHADAARAHI